MELTLGDTRAHKKFSNSRTNKHKQTSHLNDKDFSVMRSTNPTKVPLNKMDVLCDKDQIRHKATDFTVTDDLPEKTAAPRYRDFYQKREKTNLQKHSGHIEHPKKNHDHSKSVRLPYIYEHLYIGNKYVAESYTPNNPIRFPHNPEAPYSKTFNTSPPLNNIQIIINVSGEKLPKIQGVKIYNFSVHDDHSVVIEPQTIETIMSIIENAEKEKVGVLINCMAGTNRSPFFAICYALRKYPSEDRLVKRVNWWIKYIEYCKMKDGYKVWDTLTNRGFVNRLLCLKM